MSFEEEIENMVKDAEAHAEEDKKARELIEARNQADNLIHAVRKSMKDLGEDQIEEQEKTDIENAISELEEAMKGDDKAAIDEKSQKLAEHSGKLAERAYKQQAEAEQGQSGGEGAGGEGQSSSDDDVVDAEYEEVDDNKK